jgi:hypothetical protein
MRFAAVLRKESCIHVEGIVSLPCALRPLACNHWLPPIHGHGHCHHDRCYVMVTGESRGRHRLHALQEAVRCPHMSARSQPSSRTTYACQQGRSRARGRPARAPSSLPMSGPLGRHKEGWACRWCNRRLSRADKRHARSRRDTVGGASMTARGVAPRLNSEHLQLSYAQEKRR